MQQKSVSPAMVIAAVAIVLVIVGIFAYQTVFAPKASVSGIGANGQPMTQADIQQLRQKMSGGRAK